MPDLSVLLGGRRKLGLAAVTARGAAGTSHTGARAGQAALSSGAPGARGCQALSLLRRAGAIGFSGSAQKAGTLGCANSFAP